MEHLIFQLYGPMAAWGEIAVGERRASSVQPSKSAIIGLLGAALGIRRNEDERHRQLANTYGMGVRVDARGELLRDYHTAQTPPGSAGRKFYSRRDELSVLQLNTILSQRDYRVDARYTISLWVRTENPPYSLHELEDALRSPRFVLYLGRKSCPPALPFQPQVISADTLQEAFSLAVFPRDGLPDLPEGELVEFTWEEHSSPGLEASMVYPRRDGVLSRRRWQFAERDEYYVAQSRETDP